MKFYVIADRREKKGCNYVERADFAWGGNDTNVRTTAYTGNALAWSNRTGYDSADAYMVKYRLADKGYRIVERKFKKRPSGGRYEPA